MNTLPPMYFGLERETLRVDNHNRLAQTPHPFPDDEHITRDFCENQVEIITPVCHSIPEMMNALLQLHQKTEQKLKEQNEHLWIYSNPPCFTSEQEIPIAKFTGEQASKQNYRLKLQQRYGKKLMLYSGIHFNFSFQDAFLRSVPDRNAFYLHLYKQLSCYSWLLVLLTASSAVYDLSFEKEGQRGTEVSKYASMRNSVRGYWNQFIPELDYTSLESYAASIQNYIDKGILFSASELYLPVRMKPRGENTLRNLTANGIDHLELRMFDLNPFTPLGISETDLQFTRLLILWLTSLPDFRFTPELQAQAIENHQKAALYDIRQISINGQDIREAGLSILGSMDRYFSDIPEAADIINFERKKLTEKRNCEYIKECMDFYV